MGKVIILNGVPHQVHPSRPAAVRFAEDSGRANRNALYQINMIVYEVDMIQQVEIALKPKSRGFA